MRFFKNFFRIGKRHERKIITKMPCEYCLFVAFRGNEKSNPAYKTHAEFARAAFFYEANPVKTWQAIRLGQKGKPREVSVAEAFYLAEAMGEKIDRLLIKSELMIESGWDVKSDVFEKEENKQPGRPSKKNNQKLPLETSGAKTNQFAISCARGQNQAVNKE